MKQSKHPRAVVGLILLAILGTVALGLQERRSAPLAADSPASPVRSGPRAPDRLRDQPPPLLGALRQVGTRAFWLQPWPWILVGLVGFGLLAWGLVWGVRRLERD